MSGGHYDYVYRKMEEGDAEAFLACSDELRDDLRKLRERLVTGDRVSFYVRDARGELVRPIGQSASGISREISPLERLLAVAGIDTTIAGFEKIAALASALRDELRKMTDLAHDLEWWRSCDSSADDVIDGILTRTITATGVVLPPQPAHAIAFELHDAKKLHCCMCGWRKIDGETTREALEVHILSMGGQL